MYYIFNYAYWLVQQLYFKHNRVYTLQYLNNILKLNVLEFNFFDKIIFFKNKY
jgi:hypothetical protein